MLQVDLADRVQRGDRRALARYITLVEDGSADPSADFGPDVRRTPVVGITGPPGAGKSTLVDALVGLLRQRDAGVGVLAVDPSSPVTGGALLGDRVRMQGHVDDPAVFIRSMASRGHLGGLAIAAGPTLAAMSVAGFDMVIVETVGVGQSEVEVMDLADLIVLVVAPGWGDRIQADKAGIIEVADLVVVNKGDLEGADGLASTLKSADESRSRPITVTTATSGDGVAGLLDLIDQSLSPS